MSRVIEIIGDGAREFICELAWQVPLSWFATFSEPTRTLEQNRLMWPLLSALSQQLYWPSLVSGKWLMSLHSEDDWKDFLTANFNNESNKLMRGMNGNGLVMVGARTSRMGKKRFSEFIEFIYAFGAQHDVDFNLGKQ